MKINKKLLPIKLHFFFSSAGMAPVALLPVFARHLGFTAVSVGWIQTVCPVVLILIKPLAGVIIDKYKCQRFVFLTLLFLAGFFGFCIQWIKPLPTTNNVQVMCNGSLFITVCSDKLMETQFANKLFYSLNSSVMCKASTESNLIYISKDAFEGPMNSEISNKNNGHNFVPESLDMNLRLEEVSKIENECAIIRASNSSIFKYKWLSKLCNESCTDSLNLSCNDELLQNVINKPAITDKNILSTYQFWALFFLMNGSLLGFCISNSLADVFSFGLLGKKPENYGFQRMWAPIGWGLSSMISGVVVDKRSEGQLQKDYTSVFYTMIILISIDTVISSFIKAVIPEKSESIAEDIKSLFHKAKVRVFAFWCFICGFYFSFIWNFLLWFVEDLAIAGGAENKAWIKTLEGLVLTSQCYFGELPFLFFSGKIMKILGRTNCMTLVLFVFGLRFLLYSILSNPWWIIPIESLQGISYALMYATMTTHAIAISPPGAQTSVQNIFTSLFEGAGSAVGGVVGGYLISGIGAPSVFFLLGSSAVALGFMHMLFQKFLGSTHKLINDADNTRHSESQKESLEEKEDLV